MQSLKVAFTVAAVGTLASACSPAHSDALDDADIDYFESLGTSAFATGESATRVQSVGLHLDDETLRIDPAISPEFTQTVPVNSSTSCPAGGGVWMTGNIRVTCPDPPATGACSATGMTTIRYDCHFNSCNAVGGTLYLNYTGSGTSATMTLTGSLTLTRSGATGGSCSFFLTARTSTRSVTGTVCGRVVNSHF